MPKKSGFKPGQKVPKSGQWQIIDPKGKKGPERTLVKNEPFPPTLQPNSTFTLVDETKHQIRK